MDRPNFPRWTIINFVEQLAEGTPMPGGGCAVSVVGALAAALGSLSGQISLKKETDPAQKDILRDLQPQMDRARQTFLDLIDADALAYHEVVLARRLPHKNDGGKRHQNCGHYPGLCRGLRTAPADGRSRARGVRLGHYAGTERQPDNFGRRGGHGLPGGGGGARRDH